MKIVTKDIIRILTFNDELKTQLLSEWDTYSEDKRLNLEEIIWDTYADLYQMRYDMNTDIAIQELSEGEQPLDTKFAERIRQQTDDEFEQLFQQGIPVANLVEARDKLQDLIKNAVTDETAKTSEDTNDTASN